MLACAEASMTAIRIAALFFIAGLVLSAAQAAEQPKFDPDIAGIEQTTCLAKGGTFTIDGANFGPGTGLRLVAVDSAASFVDLPAKSWTDTKIVAAIPGDASISDGRIYAIGVALAGANAILSNQVTAPVCAAAAPAPAASQDSGVTLGFGLGFGLGGGSRSGGRAPSGGAPAPAPAPQMGTPSYGQSAPAQPQPQPQQPRGTSSGGGGVGVGVGIGLPLGPPSTTPPPAPAAPAVPPPATSIDVEPGEIVTLFETAAAADTVVPQAAAIGYSVKRREDLAGLGLVLIVFQVPAGTPVAAGVAALRQAFPGVIIDANHRYALQQAEGGRYGLSLIGWHGVSADCGANFRIGVLDTGVDLGHPALSTRKIEAKTFVTMAAGETLAPPDHGTAVAAILVGDPASGDFTGVLPAAQLYSAAIFKISGLRGQITTTEAIMRGLSWLAGNKVTLVNMSFAGPHNAALDAVVHASLKSNVTIVAAAGNGGPSAPPAYPAAQDGVIAATAVDAALGPYAYANRGSYVAFAAPGVDVWLAAPGGGGKIESGTSFAAPFVTAAFAETLAAGNPAADASQKLIKTARDLGPPGRDETFGYGLVQLPNVCGPK
jgi:hypothetical protein